MAGGVTREVPRFEDYGYGYVLTIPKVCTYSQSSAQPEFSDYGQGYVSREKEGFQSNPSSPFDKVKSRRSALGASVSERRLCMVDCASTEGPWIPAQQARVLGCSGPPLQLALRLCPCFHVSVESRSQLTMRWCALLVGFPLLDTPSCVTLLPNF